MGLFEITYEVILCVVLGILFLLRDLNVWSFWNIQWWTALFLLVGLGGLCSGCCPECKKLHKKK
jgi:hypothetical protein